MNAAGFRVEPKCIYFVIVTGTKHQPIIVDKGVLKAAPNDDDPEQFKYYRERVVELFDVHTVQSVGLRFREGTSRGTNQPGPIKRVRIEGVLMEAAAARGIQVAVAGASTHIGSKLETDEKIGAYVNKVKGEAEFRGVDIDDWDELHKEAMLVATAALN